MEQQTSWHHFLDTQMVFFCTIKTDKKSAAAVLRACIMDIHIYMHIYSNISITIYSVHVIFCAQCGRTLSHIGNCLLYILVYILLYTQPYTQNWINLIAKTQFQIFYKVINFHLIKLEFCSHPWRIIFYTFKVGWCSSSMFYKCIL